jgi:hypothetical protein
MPKELHVTMPDTSVWAVPVDIIARNRAEFYAEEFGGDVEKSLNEDTNPLFEEDHYAIRDWAGNNMNWSDVSEHAKQVSPPKEPDFEEGWINGDKSILDINS